MQLIFGIYLLKRSLKNKVRLENFYRTDFLTKEIAKMGMIKIPKKAEEKFLDNVTEIFSTGNLAEGTWNEKLSEFFQKYTSVRYAVPFCSNGAGLLAILMLLKRYRGYENIFIQSNTMYGVKTIAITSGLKYLGAADCSMPSLMPSLHQVEEFISSVKEPKRTVFLLSHIGGIVNPDIASISLACEKAGIALVEDCAHSLGSTLENHHTGGYGIAGVYSLYATKAISAGEGGIAITNDSDLAKMLSRFNIYDRFDQKQEIGINFRISEVQALFSFCMCEMSEEIISNKNLIAKEYITACNDAHISFVNPHDKGQRGNHYKFTLLANKDSESEFAGIKNRTSSVYDYALGHDPMNLSKRHICLPIWYALEPEIVEKTIEQIGSIHKR